MKKLGKLKSDKNIENYVPIMGKQYYYRDMHITKFQRQCAREIQKNLELRSGYKISLKDLLMMSSFDLSCLTSFANVIYGQNICLKFGRKDVIK